MCTVLLPPADNPIAVNKYIYIYLKSRLQRGRNPKPRRGKLFLADMKLRFVTDFALDRGHLTLCEVTE